MPRDSKSNSVDPGSKLGWGCKFGVAIAALGRAICEERSFWVHIPTAIVVITLAVTLNVDWPQFCILILCVALVISAELLNTALEQLVRVLHPDDDPRIGYALDAAAAAVLVLSLASVVIGIIILGPPLWIQLCSLA